MPNLWFRWLSHLHHRRNSSPRLQPSLTIKHRRNATTTTEFKDMTYMVIKLRKSIRKFKPSSSSHSHQKKEFFFYVRIFFLLRDDSWVILTNLRVTANYQLVRIWIISYTIFSMKCSLKMILKLRIFADNVKRWVKMKNSRFWCCHDIPVMIMRALI